MRDGKVVKGVNFVGIKEVGDPVQCAIDYDRQVNGIHLHVNAPAIHYYGKTALRFSSRVDSYHHTLAAELPTQSVKS